MTNSEAVRAFADELKRRFDRKRQVFRTDDTTREDEWICYGLDIAQKCVDEALKETE